MRKILLTSFVTLSLFHITACHHDSDEQPMAQSTAQSKTATPPIAQVDSPKESLQWLNQAAQDRADIYAPFELNADLSSLSVRQKSMLKLLIEAAEITDQLFWEQSYGEKNALMQKLSTEQQRNFANLNYGPWDRLNGDKPLFTSIGEKPLGAQFYPADMTKEEFEKLNLPDKKGLYSLIRRDGSGQLRLVPYHIAYQSQLSRISDLLKQASALADDPEFAQFLNLRAEALMTDDFQPSDFAWMKMKSNPVELVIGPIETYEDQLFGYRAAYESYVLIKDLSWSKRLEKYASFLPELQKGLPVTDAYKPPMSGTGSDLNAYDVIYYAGHSNAGSKTIAINLPNDEEVQLKMGTRRLQLKNAMKAKFDKILIPIAEQLISPQQLKHVKFYAFFANTMFHEVAHGLGIKNTLAGNSSVRQALKENASAFEEGKADILGLYMVTELFKKGELEEGELMDYYTTFLAGIFRSVRFGASSAHGKANMLRFNYFKERNAFSRNESDGTYSVNFEKFQQAMTELSHDLLTIQGDGDYQKAKEWLETKGVIDSGLQQDLSKLDKANIPVDVYFKQGVDVLGL